jgi:transcription factor 1
MYQVYLTYIVQLFLTDHTPSLLGAGAKNLLPKLTDKNLPANERVDIKKNPRSLELHEWALLVRAFKKWPFRPQVQHFCFI